MGGAVVENKGGEDGESATLLVLHARPPSRDAFYMAYAIYFTMGTGFLLTWNAFVTTVDYFSYLYPAASVDRVFAVAYMTCGFLSLLFIAGWWVHCSDASLQINSGLILCLLVIHILDAAYVRGGVGLYDAYHATVVAIAVSGVANVLIQGGVFGSARELPERYMKAVVTGTAASCNYGQMVLMRMTYYIKKVFLVRRRMSEIWCDSRSHGGRREVLVSA